MIRDNQNIPSQASSEFSASMEKRRGKYKSFSALVQKEYVQIELALQQGIATLDEILVDLCKAYHVDATKNALKSALQRIRAKRKAIQTLKVVANVDVEPYLQQMSGEYHRYAPPPQRDGGNGGQEQAAPQAQFGMHQGYFQQPQQPSMQPHPYPQQYPHVGSYFNNQNFGFPGTGSPPQNF